jgi:hypothetical protein
MNAKNIAKAAGKVERAKLRTAKAARPLQEALPKKPAGEKGRKGERETVTVRMSCNILAEGGPARWWSIRRCKKFDGDGPIYPLELEYATPVQSARVALWCMREQTREGFRYFNIQPTKGKA